MQKQRRRINVRNLAYVVVSLLVVIVAVGFYRSWFRVSTENADRGPSATITVDKDKIRADDQKAKDALEGFEQDAKNKIAEEVGVGKEPARQP
jgi:hypothetical protein